MVYYSKDGIDSEWNEAALKYKRLDEQQENINLLKLDLLGKIGNEFKYAILLRVIENLYKEGRSKYSADEKEEVDKILENCNLCLKLFPPHKQVVNHSVNKSAQLVDVINPQNYKMYLSLITYFEDLVKDYNDQHGLTTKNRRKGGMF